jgi:porin
MLRTITLATMTLAAAGIAFANPVGGDEVTIDVVYTGEVMSNVHGGIKTGTVYMDNFDLMLTADLSKAGLEGGTLFVYGLYNNAQTFSDRYTGDAQVISNIDSERHYRLYEAWYEHRFAGDRASIKAGLIDLNSEFDTKETGSLFINSAHGIGTEFSQTGLNGPSIFPSTSLAVRADAALGSGVKIRVGAFDAVPNDPDDQERMSLSWSEGTLYIAETEFTAETGLRVALGAWTYSSKFEPIDPDVDGKVGGNRGLYGIIEGSLGERVRAYARAGTADADINQFQNFLSGGIVLNHPLPGRADDQLGFAVAQAINGSPFKDSARVVGAEPERAETNLELTYRAQITDWLTIQPDVQYVLNAGAVEGLEDPLVLGVRFELSGTF